MRTLTALLCAWTLALATLSIPTAYTLAAQLGWYPSLAAALYHLPDPDSFQEIRCTSVLGQQFCKAR